MRDNPTHPCTRIPLSPHVAALPFSINRTALPILGLLVFILAELIWLASIVAIARQKTADPFDRIVWLLIVLSLNILGTILYALFFPHNVIDPNRYQRRRYPQPPQQNHSRPQARPGKPQQGNNAGTGGQ